MILDSSVLVAILRGEPETATFATIIQRIPERRISAVNYVEAAVISDRSRDPIARRRFDELVQEINLTIEEVTPKQALLARQAYRDFGKGSGHPARLNFGDCFAYALAKDFGEPLLFKGEDFSHTDVTPAADLG
jgi:ribonuclease VapC